MKMLSFVTKSLENKAVSLKNNKILLTLKALSANGGAMNKKLTLVLIGLMALCVFGMSNTYAYTIADPVGDQIGVRAFDLYGMNISHAANTITFDIFSNYPKAGLTVGSWNTFAGDLALDLNGDHVYEYGVAFTAHDGLTAGGVYAVNNWNISNNYAPSGYTYNQNQIVTIGTVSGAYKELANLTWTDIAGDSPDFKWSVTLNGSDFGLSKLEGQNFNIFYSVATCSNDNMSGSYTVTPEPATMSLLGLGLLGLLGFGKKKNA